MKALTINPVAGTTLNPSVTLTGSGHQDKIRIWTDQSKTSEIIIGQPSATFTFDEQQLPKTVYVEGVGASSSLRDITLSLQCTLGGHIFKDDIKLTVFDFTMQKCDSTFMPKGGDEDNGTTITATIHPSDLLGTIRFGLYDVSAEPGFCVNKPDTLPSSGEDSASWKDMQFNDQQTGFTVNGDNRSVSTTNFPVSNYLKRAILADKHP